MKMKKVLTGLVLFGATLALVACGNSSSDSKSSSSSEAPATTVEKTAAAWKDGTYTGESDFDERGWKVVHSITIKDGKITESAFGYADKDGNLKADNEEYNKSMKDKSGVSSKEATEQLNAQLVKTQDVDAVEVVSGATHTSDNFTAATKALLAAAEEGNTDPVTFELGK
ncbi:FMN-binding protein [Streptococcus sp.]|uniref:FMN-binding protein n=1 Tax=Streptococcus sp. TaxID=1306 RepID=UPI00359FC85D